MIRIALPGWSIGSSFNLPSRFRVLQLLTTHRVVFPNMLHAEFHLHFKSDFSQQISVDSKWKLMIIQDLQIF